MIEKKTKKPAVEAVKNGPFMVKNVDKISWEYGEKLPHEDTLSICRCGKSKKQPYCDGNHVKTKFNDSRKPGRPNDKERNYYGKDITVHFNLLICNHNAACLNGLPEVFDIDKRPWIMAHNAPAGKLISTIKKCPTGALSYTKNGKKHRNYGFKQEIILDESGPMVVRGGIKYKDPDGNKPVTEDHYVLCRCGASKNMPFCDGEHFDI